MVKVVVTSGTNTYWEYSRASTKPGWIKAAKKIWPYYGLTRVKIKVYQHPQVEGQDPLIWECQTDIS